MDERPVTLFTQDGCADSGRVRACLRRSGVPFLERNVTGDHAAAEALAATGVFATPLVHAGEHVIVGARLGVLADALGFRCRCHAFRQAPTTAGRNDEIVHVPR